MNLVRKLVLSLAVGVLGANAADTKPFLFLKTGEKFATQELAGPTVAEFTRVLGERIGVLLDPQEQNQPAAAVHFATAKKPVLGIVTPGFFFTYEKALGMEPLLEVNRTGVPQMRYVLVVPKAFQGGLTNLAGKSIATPLAPEQRYVSAVILQGKPGDEVRYVAVDDAEGALFDLMEAGDDGPHAALLELPTWNAYREDDEIADKLESIFESDELPRDLVVMFNPNADGLEAATVKSALHELKQDEKGAQVLSSIQVDEFVDLNQERLNAAREAFRRK